MKRNFIIYHFLVESKPHEETDLLITAASVNIYQTKKGIPIVIKTFFSYGKLKKLPYFWAIFSWTPSLPEFLNKPSPLPPLPVILGGRKLWSMCKLVAIVVKLHAIGYMQLYIFGSTLKVIFKNYNHKQTHKKSRASHFCTTLLSDCFCYMAILCTQNELKQV